MAALAHDIGHRGRSNVFLVESDAKALEVCREFRIEHELAVRYNAGSPTSLTKWIYMIFSTHT